MITLTLLAILYFLPTLLASHRGHAIPGVLLLNLFFGWTGIGWFALLVWALCSTPRFLLVSYAPYYPQPTWRR